MTNNTDPAGLSSSPRYRVVADRDTGDDPVYEDTQDTDRVTVEGYGGDERIVRIERPVPTTDADTERWHGEQDARLARMRALDRSGRPSLPTREQIADYSELRADLATMARQERTPNHWAIGRNQRTARSALTAIDTLLALILNGADR